MRRLVGIELDKALRNRWFAISIVVACALACTAATQGISAVLAAWDEYEGVSREWTGLSADGSYGQWMLVGLSAAREVFFLLLPLLAVVPYATSLRSEQVEGVLGQMFVRMRRGRYLVSKGVATFVSGFLVGAVPLVLNFLVLSCFLPAYAPEALDGLYFGMGPDEAFAGLFYGVPLAYVVVNVLVDGALCGAWALLVLAVSVLVDNRVLLLAGSFLFLLLMRHLNSVAFLVAEVNGFRFNLIGLLQGWSASYVRSVPVLVALLATSFVLAVGLLRARRDSDVL